MLFLFISNQLRQNTLNLVFHQLPSFNRFVFTTCPTMVCHEINHVFSCHLVAYSFHTQKQSCREYTTCYNCMYNEKIGGGCDEQNIGRYNIAGRQHANGQIFLMCVDEAGSCERQRCECDRSLAEKLAQYEPEWNQSHHRRWGQPVFDFDRNCKKKSYHSVVFGTPQPMLARVDYVKAAVAVEEYNPDPHPVYNGNSESVQSITHPTGATLRSIDRSFELTNEPMPLMQRTVHVHNHTPAVYGPIVGCCGRVPDVHYFREGQKCCPDGTRVDNRQECL